jgi:hypothetical protein
MPAAAQQQGRGESTVGSAGSATVSTGCQVARRRPSRGFLLPEHQLRRVVGGCARDQAAGWLWHLVVDSASEVPADASGVGRDTADSGGGDSGLAGQPDIGEPGRGQAESAAVYGPAGPVEGTDRGKVIHIRPIAGGEDYGVDLLRGPSDQTTPSGVRRLNIRRSSGRPAATAAA